MISFYRGAGNPNVSLFPADSSGEIHVEERRAKKGAAALAPILQNGQDAGRVRLAEADEFLTTKRQVRVDQDIRAQPCAIRAAIKMNRRLGAAPPRAGEDHARTVARAKGFDALRLV